MSSFDRNSTDPGYWVAALIFSAAMEAWCDDDKYPGLSGDFYPQIRELTGALWSAK